MFTTVLGDKHPKIAPILYAKCKTENIRVIDVNKKADQYSNSVVCGHESVAFLLTIHKFGIKSGFEI